MEKQQQLIELAKLNNEYRQEVAEFQAKKSLVRKDCSRQLKEARDETERFNIIAETNAALAKLEAELSEKKADISRRKIEIITVPETVPEAVPETVPEAVPEVITTDGSVHGARITARRIINRLPLPKGCLISVSISNFSNSQPSVEIFFHTGDGHGVMTNTVLAPWMTFEELRDKENAFVERCKELAADRGNSHVATPLDRALDAVFGYDPVKTANDLEDSFQKGGDNE